MTMVVTFATDQLVSSVPARPDELPDGYCKLNRVECQYYYNSPSWVEEYKRKWLPDVQGGMALPDDML